MQKTTLILFFTFFNFLFSSANNTPKPLPFNLDFEITVSITGDVMVEYNGYNVYETAAWEFEYGPEGFLPGQGTTVQVSGLDFHRLSLNPLQKYAFRIRENHFDGNSIEWTEWSQSKIIFASNDNSFSMGYTIDFNNTTEDNLEWKGLLYNNSKNNAYVALSSNANHGDKLGHSIIMSNLDNGISGHVAFVSPRIKDLATDRKIRFWVNDYDSREELLVGTMTDPNDPTTFHLLAEVERVTTNNWEPRTIYFNNYIGNDQFIVFKFKNKSYSYNGDATVYLDDFSYEQASNCYDQSNFKVSNVQDNTVEISFDSPNQTNFQVSLKNMLTELTEIFNKQSSPFTISDLSGNTNYEVKLRANCIDDLFSNWTPTIAFTTLCTSFSQTYSTSFEGAAYIDPCWTTNTNYAKITKDKETDWKLKPIPKTGNQMIVMNSFGTTSEQKSYLITPYIANLDASQRIKFSLIAYSSDNKYNTNTMTIGTMSDPQDVTTFIALKTIEASEMNEIDNPNKLDLWKEHTVYLDNYQNSTNHHYIALKQNNLANSIFCIDDFSYQNTPSCIEPLNPRTLSSGIDFATITWDNYKPATEWQVEYGLKGFAHGTGIVVNATSSPFTINNAVLDDTEYDFYVRAKCGTDFSDWSDKGFFKTKCLGVSQGYKEDFEKIVFEKNGCWTRIVPTIDVRYWDKNSFMNVNVQPANESSVHSGLQSISMLNQLDSPYSFTNKDVTDAVVLVSPRLKDFDHYKKISFWILASNQTNNLNIELTIGTLSDPENHDTFTSYQTIVIPVQKFGKWVKYEMDFSNYYGTDKYIGFKQTKNNARLSKLYIDDFEYMQNDCPRPGQLEAGQSGVDSVLLNWKDNNTQKKSDSWDIEYGLIGFAAGTGTIVNVKTSPFNLTGLTENSYEYRVRTYCETNIASDWSERYSFKIVCTKTAPYVENFDAYKSDYDGIIDFCWTYNNHQYTRLLQYNLPNINSAPDVFLLEDESGPAYLISPFLSDFDQNKKIKFWIVNGLASQTTSGSLIIGTIKNPLDLSTFEPYEIISFDEVRKIPAYGKEYSVDFSSYTGTNKQIAFRFKSDSDENYGTNRIIIDDIHYDTMAGCSEPIDIVFSNVIDNSVQITWNSKSQVSPTVQIEYGIRGFIPGNGTKISTKLNDITIDNLLGATKYDFYFKTICNDRNSVTVGPKKLDTSCAVENLPWSENLNTLSEYGEDVLPSCFKHSSGHYTLANEPIQNFSNYYNHLPYLNGFDDNSFFRFSESYSSFFSPMFHLVAGTTYKFSLKALKGYEYSFTSISVFVGRGQNEYNLESQLSKFGTLSEYSYNDIYYYYTPLTTGDYSYQIMAVNSGSAHVLIDNLKLEEGYSSTIDNKSLAVKYDFEDTLDEALILESTSQSQIDLSQDPLDQENHLIIMNGGNAVDNWKPATSLNDKKASKATTTSATIWETNPDFITKLNMKVDARNAKTLFMQFDVKQTFNQNNNESVFRVLVNGKMIGNEIRPITKDTDAFATKQYDLSAYIGTEIRISLQHIGKSAYDIGDNAFLDNLYFSPTATLSVVKNEFENLKYYPNPIENVLNIESNSLISKVEIYNSHGQKLFESEFSKSNVALDFKKYPTGVYFVTVKNEDKEKTFKVIKN